jgi:phosphoglycolate phosphatase-like HAD superfamily hydrolase
VFRNGATIDYEAAIDTVLRLGNATEVLRAEAESEARGQRLAAERAVDTVLADSFPASDPPSWTLGITRPQPELQVTSDDTVVPDERQAALARENVIDVSRPATNERTFLKGLVSLAGAAGIALLVRTLGVAGRWLTNETLSEQAAHPDERLEHDLTFAGLIGIIDPPRPEAKDAVARARRAGIRPMMITGDHPRTAGVIAQELGITTDGRAITGSELDRLPPDARARTIAEVSVYARVNPEHKLRIIDVLRRSGAVAAMTGDGVNDAPALKKADIGVAMGITGTDVSKEAADMVLADDNFATIVAAVEKGGRSLRTSASFSGTCCPRTSVK